MIPQRIDDHLIATPQGRVFARSWAPTCEESLAPILLIHDSLGSVALWRDFPGRLCDATQRRVIAYDRLGFGSSDARVDRLRSTFVREEAALHVPPLLQYFGIDRFVPFGHSVGGGMAVCCGALLGDRCAAIITESTQMYAEEQTLRAIAAARAEYANADKFARLGKYHGEKAEWVLHAWVDTWLSPAFACWNVKAELAQLRSPLLAVHGELDEFGSLDHLGIARQFSSAAVTTRVLQGQGHVPHRERPDTLLTVVADFLMTVE